MIELQKCVDKEQWDDYILENGGHPLQLWGWGQVKAGHGWTAERLFAIEKTDQDEEKIVGAAQVLTRKLPLPMRAFSYVPRGPVGEKAFESEFLDSLASFVKREHKSVALSIEPNAVEFTVSQGWHNSNNRILPAETISLDLDKSESQLLADMVKKTRQYIRKSAAEGIVIKPVRTIGELQECLAIYHQTSQRAKFDLHQDQYYIDVFNLLGDSSPVFAAYINDEPVAFLWLAISADTAFELYGGMNEGGQELRVNYALKWHAIRKTKEWGLKTYDLGGLINDGVSNFKRSWSNEETHLAGTFDKPLSAFYGLWSKGLPAAKVIVRRLKR